MGIPILYPLTACNELSFIRSWLFHIMIHIHPLRQTKPITLLHSTPRYGGIAGRERYHV